MMIAKKGLNDAGSDYHIQSVPTARQGSLFNKTQEQIAIGQGNSLWPRITIITPSFNQGRYLETTILSVVSQNYQNYEYIVIDGGSTDDSIEIIRRYEQFISYWESRPDKGQSQAINKGLARATGDWVAWLNSDDYYLPGTLHAIARTILENPDCSWIAGGIVMVDDKEHHGRSFMPYCPDVPWSHFTAIRRFNIEILQPSTFWSKEALRVAGLLDESLRYAMDFEYWCRLAKNGYRPFCISSELAAFRLHDSSKSNEGVVPFWTEEIQVIDKLMDTVNEKDRQVLLKSKCAIRRELMLVKAKNMIRKMMGRIVSL